MIKYPIVKKAYQIDLSKIAENYFYSETICYAETRSKAKSKLLADGIDQGMAISTHEELTFLNIPVIRCPQADVLLFEEKELTNRQIEELLQQRERHTWLDSILDDATVKFCYIEKRGQYYKPNSSGYTEYKTHAGVYAKEKAVKDAKYVSELNVIPIDILEHNQRLINQIEDLKSRLIS